MDSLLIRAEKTLQKMVSRSAAAKERIKKAAFTSTDLSTGGGLLAPVQSKKLLALMRIKPGLIQHVTFIPMAGPTYRIDRMQFGSRILHVATENTELDSSLEGNPTGTKVELSSNEFIAVVPITYSALEDSIMSGRQTRANEFEDFLLQLVAARIGEDVEEIAINSDTSNAGLHADLQVFDGFLKEARDNATYNAGGAAISKSVFKGTHLQLPKQYRADKTGLSWVVSPNAEVEWRDELADKSGTKGADDAAFGTSPMLKAYGIPMIVSGKMPEESGTSSNLGEILHTHPKNMIIGVQRDVRFEIASNPAKRRIDIYVTIRFDCGYYQVEGSVLMTNVKVA
jgi:HK97 family phage major capsid protein